MKVAVATDQGMVSPHFGRCAQFTIAEIVDGRIGSIAVVPNPGHDHAAIPALLVSNGVSAVICGGIGPGAVQHLTAAGITIYPGVSGPVNEALAEFAAGRLVTGSVACRHEGCGGHHCQDEHESGS